MKHMSCLSAAVALLFCSSAGAGEWFVSPDGVDADGRGAESAPLRTINYAVGKASADDTITLFPGDYIEGSSNSSRVDVTKRLTIRSKNGRSSRDATRIVGAYDATATSPVGMGANAVRCVRIDSAAAGTRLEGITFYRGSTAYNGNAGSEATEGGGVIVCGDGAATATIVDCAFVECQATRGGGIFVNSILNDRVSAVRCRFLRCRDTKFGAAMRGGAAYFCVFDDCGKARDSSGSEVGDGDNPKDAFAYGYRAVNCTFVNNMAHGIRVDTDTFKGGIYNCLFQNNAANSNAGSIRGTPPAEAKNVVGSALYTKFEVLSPFDDDYRLTSQASALGAGSADYTTVAYIPEEFLGLDYNGNSFNSAGTVHAGAVQEAIAGNASGVQVKRTSNGEWSLGGKEAPVCVATWRGAEGWRRPQQVKFSPRDGLALIRFAFSNAPHWPLADDSIWVSPKNGQVQELSTVTTSNKYYVNPQSGSDSNPGTSEAPFKTLNAAVNATTASHVVYALQGDYNEGGESHYDANNRVVVRNTLAGELRVVAVDGPESTFITGAAGTGDATYGTGSGATRCIAVASTNKFYAAFQGFTIRDGHSDNGDGNSSWGGGLNNLGSGANLATAYLVGCVISNCVARRGGAMSGGSAVRCRFLDCRGANNGGGGVFRRCTVVSSLIDGCGGNTELFAQDGAVGCNCTVVNSTKSAVYSSSSSAACLYNSVVGIMASSDKSLNDNTKGGVTNTLYDTKTTNASIGSGCQQENPVQFQDAAIGNYRLAELSKGYSLASTEYMETCMDVDGNPFVINDDNKKYQAGCYAPRPASELTTYYVDLSGGSDSNDGSEATPFATLAKAMSVAEYGDTVVALPGTYSSGTMMPSTNQTGGVVVPTVAARVVVKGGVTLESRDGAESTIIDGGNEVRGAFVCKNAVLRGFTVQNCKVNTSSDAPTVNDYGGGIACHNGGYSGLVERCVIKDCLALRGGGASYGTYRNCVFTGNTLGEDKPGWAVRMARLEGCYFYGNGSADKHSTAYYCSVFNCTFLGNNAGANSNNGIVCNEGSYVSGCPVRNSIILGNMKSDVSDASVGCITDSELAKLDANGVPQTGSAAIDCIADDSTVPEDLLAAGDAAGSPRKMNGKVDCGAFEYDWRVPWSAALGRRIAIDDIAPDATLKDGRLVFPDGVVSLTWTSGGATAPYAYHVVVTGNGTLTVNVNGETVGSYTSADGEMRLRFRSPLDKNQLQFVYVPGEDDAGGAGLYGFSHQQGLAIMIR